MKKLYDEGLLLMLVSWLVGGDLLEGEEEE